MIPGLPHDRSLALDEADGTGHGGPWPVFGDVALSLLLVLLLFILAQFLYYQNVFVLDRIKERKEEVRALVLNASTEVLGPSGAVEVQVDNEDGLTTQRIIFPEPMLFDPCGTTPRPDGRRLIEAVGRALDTRAGYFQGIQIEGHADRIPPSGQCQVLVRDNWGLSSARATEFLRILVAPQVFGDPRLVSAVGRGDTRPRSEPGAPIEQLGQDRRVELLLVYDTAMAAPMNGRDLGGGRDD